MDFFTSTKSDSTIFAALCKRRQVAYVFAFGSTVNGKFNTDTSDVDLLVQLNINDPIEYGETLLALWDELEFFFKRKVDLLTEDSIKNPYLKKSIDDSKVLIYDGQREKVFV